LWLRGSGVVAVLAAASTFMLQRWDDGTSDDWRYLYLLAHGVMLFAAALFCGARMKESRTARTFLLLTLGTLPACFAVLGGLVLSRFSWESVGSVPHFALWRAHSDLTAIAWVATTLGLGWGLTRLAAHALARHSGARIAWTFILSQSLLLIPVRDPTLTGPLAMLGMLGALELERHWRTRSGMRTFEGRTIRAMYWIAPALVLGRGLTFYGINALTVGSVTIAIGVAAFLGGTRTHSEALREVLEKAGASVAALGVGLIGIQLKAMLFPAAPLHLLGLLPLAGVFYAFAHAAGPARAFLLGACGATAAAAAIGAVVINGGIVSAVTALAIGVSSVALGLLTDRRVLVLSGGLSSLLGLVATVETAIGFSSLFNWGSLTLLGVGSLLTAALVERHRGHIVRRLEQGQRKEAARRVLAAESSAIETQHSRASSVACSWEEVPQP
jgi:hypothetical protein